MFGACVNRVRTCVSRGAEDVSVCMRMFGGNKLSRQGCVAACHSPNLPPEVPPPEQKVLFVAGSSFELSKYWGDYRLRSILFVAGSSFKLGNY